MFPEKINNTWVLFLNGDIYDYGFYKKYLLPGARIICSDGGLRHARKMGIVPHLIIGDFDSADPLALDEYIKMGVETETFDTRKEATDGELALRYALTKGAGEIIILGWFGGRFDHCLGNVHLLAIALENNVPAFLINETNKIRLINKEARLTGKPGGLVSLIPMTKRVTGINAKGMEYPLENETLFMGPGRGISNKMTQQQAEVTIKSGLLLILEVDE